MGAVLYEMATGRQPFRGETSIELVNAIQTDQPDKTSELNAAFPSGWIELSRKRWLRTGHSAISPRKSWPATWRADSVASASRPRRCVHARAPRQPGHDHLACHAAGTRSEATGIHAAYRQSWEELYPSLAPMAGRSFTRAESRANGRFAEGVGGQNPVSLTKDSPSEDIQPALSPERRTGCLPVRAQRRRHLRNGRDRREGSQVNQLRL